MKQAETGTPVAEVLRRMGISEQTFYRWKKLYGGLGTGELRCLKQLEDENRKLEQLVADLSLDKHILQDVLSGEGSGQQSLWAWPARMLLSRPGYRRLSEHDGSGRRAVCHQRCLDFRRSSFQGDTSH